MDEVVRHPARDGMVRLANRYGEDVTLAVIALLSPAACDDALEFLVKGAAARERRRCMVIHDQALAVAHRFGEGVAVLLGPARLGSSVFRVFVVEQEYIIAGQVLGSQVISGC